MSMVQLALKRPYTFIVMAMLIVLATPFALLNMATDIFPEINIPVISVIWNYNGLPAQEMGQRIAGQTERGLTTVVSDIEHIESTSLAGVSIIKIFFQPGVNIQTAIAQVVAGIWMLVAMIIAVRQALDYESTGRAVAVCLVGFVVQLAVLAAVFMAFGPPPQ